MDAIELLKRLQAAALAGDREAAALLSMFGPWTIQALIPGSWPLPPSIPGRISGQSHSRHH